MFARVTLLEIDTVRESLDDAIDMFERDVLPRLRQLPGYEGVSVLTTPEGKAALISLWDKREQADVDASGWYARTLGEYATLFKAPPGRDCYEVRLVDMPQRAAT